MIICALSGVMTRAPYASRSRTAARAWSPLATMVTSKVPRCAASSRRMSGSMQTPMAEQTRTESGERPTTAVPSSRVMSGRWIKNRVGGQGLDPPDAVSLFTRPPRQTQLERYGFSDAGEVPGLQATAPRYVVDLQDGGRCFQVVPRGVLGAFRAQQRYRGVTLGTVQIDRPSTTYSARPDPDRPPNPVAA